MEKSNKGPIYKHIKEDIVGDILSGIYSPGDMIPTQESLAKKYNVSRLTVRKAIDDLVRKGILSTEKGKGTYVQKIATKTYSYRRYAGFSSNIVSKEVQVHSKTISITEILADKKLASHLNINENSPVVVIERLRYINDICVCFQKSFFSKQLVKNIDFVSENLDNNSLYELLKKNKIIVSYVDERFRAIRANEQISDYFKIEEGDPVLFVLRVTYDSDDTPIEYCENFENSDVRGVWVKSINI